MKHYDDYTWKLQEAEHSRRSRNMNGNINGNKDPISPIPKEIIFGITYSEIIFEDILDYYNIDYTAQYRLDNFIYDYCLTKYNVLVEVDGSMHNFRQLKMMRS